jgi:hypothetical protein
MRAAFLAAAAALGLAGAAWASSEAFDNWVQGLSQNGWRLIAVSEPQKSALMMGPDAKDATGRRITMVRYEFMGAPGGWGGLVAEDAVDCKEGSITRVKVTGYPGNNLAGQAVEQKPEASPVSAVPNTFQEEEVHYACGMAVTVHIATASADPKKKLPADDANKMICHTEAVLGSSIPVRRCETKQQAAERRREDQEAVERGQREIPITGH